MKLALCILAATLVTDAPTAQQRPPTPEQALRAMPIAAPLATGIEILVMDGDLGLPAAGADVFVLSERATAAQRADYRRRVTAWGPLVAGSRFMLAQAAAYGTRYQTNVLGRVRVPLGCTPIVVHGSGFLWCEARPGESITVFQPRTVPVRVLDSRGRPARRVPLVLKNLDESMVTQTSHPPVAWTDGKGRADVPIPPRMLGRDTEVAILADIPTRRPVVAVVRAVAKIAAPIDLRLPPCGSVRVMLYGKNEKPMPGVISGRVRGLTRVLRSVANSQHPPTRSDGDSLFFDHVEIGQQLSVEIDHVQYANPVRVEAAGPTAAGELRIVDHRRNTDARVLRMRATAASGEPLRSQKLGRLLFRGAWRAEAAVVTTDAQGEFTLRIPQKATIMLLTHRADDATFSTTARFDVDGLEPSLEGPLPVILRRPPVAATVRLEDSDGAPRAGIRLFAARIGAGAPDLLGYHGEAKALLEHDLLSDDAGLIEIRELAPLLDRPWFVSARDPQWGLENARVDPGENRIVLVRTGSIQGSLAGVGKHGANVDVLARGEDRRSVPGRLDATGRFRIDDLHAGRWDIEISNNSGKVVVENVTVEAGKVGKDARLQSIDLSETWRSLRVTVEHDGKPVVATIRTAPVSGQRFEILRTDHDGVAEFLLARGVGIRISAPGYHEVGILSPEDEQVVELRPRSPTTPDGVTVTFAGLPELPLLLEYELSARPNRRHRYPDVAEQRFREGPVLVRPNAEEPLQWELRCRLSKLGSLLSERHALTMRRLLSNLGPIRTQRPAGAAGRFEFRLTDEQREKIRGIARRVEATYLRVGG